MNLKILHTGDLHIGMKFNSYPEGLRQQLTEARFQVLGRLVEQANEAQCRLLIIAGDLFDKTTVPLRDQERAAAALAKFAGDCVLVLPGNHDYDNGLGGLWGQFRSRMPDKVVLLNECRPYFLQDFDLDVVVYPAPCQRKHSPTNNLGWMKGQVGREGARWHIGIAHGALEGLSPDLHQEYFPMSRQELEAIPVDLWLLGHSHLPYPPQKQTAGQRVFNAGVPEPDGMDCRHEGHAWLIEIDPDRNVKGELLTMGSFRFLDEQRRVENLEDLEKISDQYLGHKPEKTLLRLRLSGLLESEAFARKEELYRRLREGLAYVRIEDSELGVRITPAIIAQEYTAGSFPHRFLSAFLEQGDEEALQIAYQLLREVKGL